MEDELGSLSASNARIMALFWADILAAYAIWILMEYLTDVWSLNFTSAAAIVNIFTGVTSIMPIGAAFLAHAFTGNFWMLILSSSAYTIGLGFLSMSTPPVLSKATGTCSSYKEECIGNVQKALFYTSLPLIAIGTAGHIVSLNSFLKEQNTETNEEEKECECPLEFLGNLALIIVVIASAIALPYIKLWSVRFGIPAICTLVATTAFISGSSSYIHGDLQGSPYTRIFRVFVAFLWKIHLPLPSNDHELHGFDECIKPRPCASRYRCLDRAAIKTREEQPGNKWNLCTVTEVDETRIALRLIPMSLTFIFVGLIISIGNTYFLEQAKHMNPKIGKLKFPLPILLLFYESAKSCATKIYNAMENRSGESLKKYAPAFGFAIGMLLSILCCIIAAKVEERRIRVIKKHGLLDKPEAKIPMSLFWLLPQFLLLGALDGIARRSITCFYRDQIPMTWDQCINLNGSNASAVQSKEEEEETKEEEEEEKKEKVRKPLKTLSMRLMSAVGISKREEEKIEEEDGPNSLRSHMTFFTWGVFGTGTIGGVLSVHIVGRVSKRGGRPSWFQATLNKSRLDNYYWTLAVLSCVVLVLYVMVALWFSYRESAGDEQEEEVEDQTNCEELLCCCY